jgi:hypothetical protein
MITRKVLFYRGQNNHTNYELWWYSFPPLLNAWIDKRQREVIVGVA